MSETKVAMLGYYHGPRLGAGVYIQQLMSRIGHAARPGHRIVFYTNRNTLTGMGALGSSITVVDSLWLNAGSVPAIFFVAIIFPLICRFQKVTVAVLLSNPVVLFSLVPTISIVHDLTEMRVNNKYGPWRSRYRRHVMLRSCMAHSDWLVVISKFTARQVQRYFPRVPADKIEIIDPGVDVSRSPMPDTPGALDCYGLSPASYFLIVGRIDPRGKSLYDALKLFRRLISLADRSDQSLVLAGGVNESCRAEANEFLQAIKRDPEFSHRVRYLGYVDDSSLAALYQGATAVIFLSRNEGFGFPMVEAFSQGCPVIYNQACGALREIAEDVGLGITDAELEGAPWNPDVFDVLYDAERRERMAIQMRSIAARYSWETCAAKYLDLFDRVSEGYG